MSDRKAFEAWATTLNMDLVAYHDQVVGQDIYSDCNTDFAWLAWQKAVRMEREAARWQSMEYAPKDQGVLLTDGHTVGEGFWHDGSECYGHRGGEGWFWESDRANLLIASNAEPTGWMPLPSPPK